MRTGKFREKKNLWPQSLISLPCGLCFYLHLYILSSDFVTLSVCYLHRNCSKLRPNNDASSKCICPSCFCSWGLLDITHTVYVCMKLHVGIIITLTQDQHCCWTEELGHINYQGEFLPERWSVKLSASRIVNKELHNTVSDLWWQHLIITHFGICCYSNHFKAAACIFSSNSGSKCSLSFEIHFKM